MNNTTVSRIVVKKLFGEFDYDFVLDENKPVSIIIGPNGCGKTTILKLLDFILSPTSKQYENIKNIPFDQIECGLLNGNNIVLEKLGSSEFCYKINGTNSEKVVFSDFSRKLALDIMYLREVNECYITSKFVDPEITDKDLLDAFEMYSYLSGFWCSKDSCNLVKRVFDEQSSITHKSIKLTGNGAKIICKDRELKITDLSSGEKRSFMEFYQIVLESNYGGVIILDEPERSKHIMWQESYIDYLIEACKMLSLQAIVVTHSPNIISSHYDCILRRE